MNFKDEEVFYVDEEAIYKANQDNLYRRVLPEMAEKPRSALTIEKKNAKIVMNFLHKNLFF